MSKDKKETKKAAKAAAKEEKKEKKANREVDTAAQNTLIKSIIAVLCVAAICFTTMSNIGKVADAKIAAAEKMYGGNGSSSESADGASSDFGDTSSDTTADSNDSTDASSDDTTADAGDSTAADSNASSSDATAPSSNDSKPSGNTGSSQKSKAEIIKLYNDATAKAASKAVPFSKERNTVEKKYEAGVALKAFKDTVYRFMGVGDKYKFSQVPGEMNKDNYHKYLQASKLTEADVVDATYTQSGANYTIVLKIKDGASSVKDGKVVSSNNAPLDRSGLACGDNDKDYWDHKTAENVISAISSVAGSANIDEKYSNAVITAVVNASTGNLVSLTAKFDFHFDLDKIMGASGVAESASTVIMKDFKW